jgi:hypothetical protein
MSAGHGGQILLSRATHDLVENRLPEGTEMRDMGERRLKDIFRPEHIYQVAAPDLPSEFPPLTTLETHTHNLPAQLTSFIGREHEIAEAQKVFSTHLTFIGPRTGKQGSACGGRADPVQRWRLADVAQLADRTISFLLSLHVPFARLQGVLPMDTVTDYLVTKVAILPDNCDISSKRVPSRTISHACPKLKMITSAEALGIAGETVYRVLVIFSRMSPRDAGTNLWLRSDRLSPSVP